jgi:modulator of FtsH protease
VPLTPEWAAFFSAELAALAALAGFVVVAISINLARILSYPHLPTRAGEALIGPVGAITATSLALVPGQPAALPGAEVIAVGLVIVIAPIAFQSRTWGLRKEAVARERIARAATNQGFNLTFVIGGALLFAGAPAGLYWIAAGDVLCIIAIVLSAWVLMVEILR